MYPTCCLPACCCWVSAVMPLPVGMPVECLLPEMLHIYLLYSPLQVVEVTFLPANWRHSLKNFSTTFPSGGGKEATGANNA